MRAPVLLSLLSLLSIADAQNLTEPSTPAKEPLHFGRAGSDLVLDGRLDEASWARASAVTGFYEVFPANVGVSPAATQARLLYDDKYIYVGIRAYDLSPQDIRSSLVRRDQVLDDQDYVEVLIDPLNARNSAFAFRTNAHGVATDAQFNEEDQLRDYSPDFNFDVRTAIDEEGWTAELRIPLPSLRYRAGDNQTWAVVVYRNLPRNYTFTLASAPIPRAANCTLCFADEIGGISLPQPGVPLDLIPYVAYTHGKDSSKVQTGIDAKWQLRPDSVLDVTLAPDFSQVEADDLQLTANTRFALALTEKRPFFLEAADLLSTPILAIYTRAFTDPDAGVRITQRGPDHEYTALLLRDAGGGTVLEPGPSSSRTALQDFESTAFVGRYKLRAGGASFGALASTRVNDDGSENLVIGADTNWALSTSDRLIAQLLWSKTENPNRPDLLASWTGQRFDGAAGSLRWEHTADSWYNYLTYRKNSHGFRTWNGFVTRVGASTLSVNSGIYFYPDNSFLTRVSPTVLLSSIEEEGGMRLSHSISPGLVFEAARDTTLSVYWSPNAQELTPIGLRSYDSYSASLVSTPLSWIPMMTLTVSAGESLDKLTGEVGDGLTVQTTLPLRLFDHLELEATWAYQSLDSRRDDLQTPRLFTEKNLQVDAIWHFSSKLYAHAMYQESRLTTTSELSSSLSSLLMSYQTNWQTRFFVGARRSEAEEVGTEIFAKLSYAL